MSEKHPDAPRALDSESVAAYLRQHPEFFVDHEELIPELRIPTSLARPSRWWSAR